MYKNEKLSIARTFAYFYIILQSIFAFLWMCANIAFFSPDRLTYDYLEAARTFVFDDYMGLLYTLLLAPIVFITSNTAVIHAIVSLVQTILVFGAFLYFSKTIFEDRLEKQDRIALALFATTIPMVIQAEFTILPNALGLCLFVLLYSGIHRIVRSKDRRAYFIVPTVCLLLSLTMQDYAVIAALIAVPVLITFINKRDYKALLCVGSAIVVLLAGFWTEKALSTPESYGRIERSALIYINQRLTMPHLGDGAADIENYCGFDPGNIIKEAINFPEKYFEGYLMTIKKACGGIIPGDLLINLMGKSLIKRTKSIALFFIKDFVYGIAPFFSIIYIYARRTTETMMSVNLLRYMMAFPDLSKIFMVFSETGTVIALVWGLVKRLKEDSDSTETVMLQSVNKHYLFYILSVFSLYYALFSFYGFDYRNMLFAITVPIALVFSTLLKTRS